MQIILGAFQPELEAALVGAVRAEKKADPLRPLLILVPSDSLRRRLKILLALEANLSVVALEILTFHQLSLRLHREAAGVEPNLISETLRRDAVRLIALDEPSAEAIRSAVATSGGAAAVAESLRDLNEAMVDPELALAALTEGQFPGSTDRTAALLNLHKAVSDRLASSGLVDYTDLDRLAIGRAATSEFLAATARVFYYGFYDLTQVQLDLFQAVARVRPVALFFPKVSGAPAWAFAERFYDRYLAGLATGYPGDDPAGKTGTIQTALPSIGAVLFSPARAKAIRPGPVVEAVSAAGITDELDSAAKKILQWVEVEGYGFSEIGVVARTLDPYTEALVESFGRHRIPLAGALRRAVALDPLAQAVLRFGRLRAAGYPRAEVIELITSPFFNRGSQTPGSAEGQAWDILTRELGVAKGESDWHRLTESAATTLRPTPKAPWRKASEVKRIWNLVQCLLRDLGGVPPQATFGELTGIWIGLLDRYFSISSQAEADDPVARAIRDRLGELACLDGLAGPVTAGSYWDLFTEGLETASIPITDGEGAGVAVLDAMSARGQSFRGVLLLGLNESVFPRIIREDAFLHDADRRVLETVLGYKVGEKLAAYDEERLLFVLILSAARERFVASYQRADETGRALAPSGFLAELRRAAGPVDEQVVPRRSSDKPKVRLWADSRLLPPRDFASRVAASSGRRRSIPRLPGIDRELLAVGQAVMTATGREGAGMTPFDGATGRLPRHWNGLLHEGVAPTTLETYARCPFQYFTVKVLDLAPPLDPESAEMPSPGESGELVHGILKAFYNQLIVEKVDPTELSDTRIKIRLSRAIREMESKFAEKHPIPYPLAWEVFREKLAAFLGEAISQDAAQLKSSGYRPVAFELPLTATLGRLGTGLPVSLPIQGRIDRLDISDRDNRYRVVDYKLKLGGARKTRDRNPVRSALRGESLQMPFYLELVRAYARSPGASGRARSKSRRIESPVLESSLFFLAPNWPDGPLVVETVAEAGWAGADGKSLRETLALLLSGIREGRFFIRPGDYCEGCPAAPACRKNHFPSRRRAERDRFAVRHGQLSKKEPFR